MQSKDTIAAVAEQVGLQRQQVESVLDSFVGAIVSGLKNGGEIRYKGLGIFQAKQRLERTGRNPRTGEPVLIPAVRTVKFKPAAEFKRSIQG